MDYRKIKILNLLLILSSLLGFLEWGKDSKLFLFQAEAEVISKLFTDPKSVLHPFTLLPLAGQILLLITLFQEKPSKILTFISVGSLGLLLAFMFVIGIVSLNIKIFFSTLPFLVISFFVIKQFKKTKI